MSVELQIEETPNYLAARFTGAGVAEEFTRRLVLIAEHCKRANKNKLLLDFWEAHAIGLSMANKYFFGEETQIFLDCKLMKLAIVARPERADPRRFGEMVIRNRWIQMGRCFTASTHYNFSIPNHRNNGYRGAESSLLSNAAEWLTHMSDRLRSETQPQPRSPLPCAGRRF
jgi:lipid-A-disaccharide synthase-like uncharacterized protein